jgi:hypothetical protein
MDCDATDSRLIVTTGGPPPTTIADVLELMQRIDNLLPASDGLKWFNLLYMMVTQKVDSAPTQGSWEDPAWLSPHNSCFLETRKASYGTNTLLRRCLNGQRRLSLGSRYHNTVSDVC